MIKYLIYILLFPIGIMAQVQSGTTIFPDNTPASNVSVLLEGEELPTSYTSTFVTYSPLATNGTSVTLYDDSNVGPFPIGFDFKFFGVTFNQFRICTNGFITFGDPSGRYSPGSFPQSSSPNGVVAPYWTDLYPSSGYYCRYRTEGSAPNRKLVISWHVTYYSSRSAWADLQVVLFEGTNDMHLTIINQGKVQRATQGVENLTGTAAFTPSGRNLASFNGAGTTYKLAPNSPSVGWQLFDSTYTDVNGEYILNGIGNNYNYRVVVEPPQYTLDTAEYVNLLYHILHPDEVRGVELTSMDLDTTQTITISDYLLFLTTNQFYGAVFTQDEYNTMVNSLQRMPAYTRREFETERDFIIMYPCIPTKNVSINKITQ
jgi:hypothetical protein